MFDKTFIASHSKEYIPYEKTIIEKRAPTDDSIRIYEEIKEKAYKSILDTIELKENTLNVNAILYDDMFNYEKVCKYRLVLNGKEITGEIRSNRLDFQDKTTIFQKIFDDTARSIATDIMKMALNKVKA